MNSSRSLTFSSRAAGVANRGSSSMSSRPTAVQKARHSPLLIVETVM